MNEKIKLLAKQAGIIGQSENDVAPPFEKFAELIVEECLGIVKPTLDHEVWAQSYLGGVDGLELLEDKVKKIKQHFGVKE